MGQIIENIQSGTFKQTTTKEMPINVQEYTVEATLQNGNLIMKTQENARYYLYHKQFQKTSENQVIVNKCLNNIYRFTCNILRYEIKSRSLLCGSHVNIKMLLEYGDKTLYQILNKKVTNRIQNTIDVTQNSEDIKFDTPLELLNFIKLMINVVEEQRDKNQNWIRFHTKNIVYFNKSQTFKYFSPCNLQEPTYNQSFFAPEMTFQNSIREKQTVFSMGMVLLGLFLNDDCSDCYNYQNHIFCASIFEDKIDKMKERMITKGLLGILDNQSQYISHFDEEVSELILQMTEKQSQRLSFEEVKKRYHWLIKKASLSLGVNNQQYSRVIVYPLTSKRMDKQNNRMGSRPNIGCFSTDQERHLKTTFTNIDQSDIFTIQHSKIPGKYPQRGKDSQALKWKKVITKRMKEQKENLPYSSEG